MKRLLMLSLFLLTTCPAHIQARNFLKSVVTFVTHNPLEPITKIIPGPNNIIPMSPHALKESVWGDNFHTVEEGVFYRSAHLSGETLEQRIKQYGIKTVINLRGANPKEQWWLDEKAVTDRNNVRLCDIAISAGTLTSKEKLSEILNEFDHAPRPILVHCRAGVDRTGEISALWMLDKMKKSNNEALEQLSLWHKHNPLMYPAKRFLIEIWRPDAWQDRTRFASQYDPKNYPQFISDVPKNEDGESIIGQ